MRKFTARGLSTVGLAAVCLAGCASLGLPPGISAQQLDDAAQVVVSQSTVWAAVAGTAATPYVVEVNGHPHHSNADGRLRLDDTFYLAPGEYAIGLGVLGNAKGHDADGSPSYGCFPFRAEASARYVLRGVADGTGYRVEVLQKQNGQETRLLSVSVAQGSPPTGSPCALSARQVSAADPAGAW